MTHIVIGIDFDGCISNKKYIFPFIPDIVGDIKKNMSIVNINQALWTRIHDICKSHPELKQVTLVHFSLRQSPRIDSHNSIKQETESSFLAMTKIRDYLDRFLKENSIPVDVNLNTLLMPDIYNDREHGDTHKIALDRINYTRVGMGTIISFLEDDPFLVDYSKITFVFAHTHAIQADAFYYFDDKLSILQAIQTCYQNERGTQFIPENVKVILQQYKGGSLTEIPPIEIEGKGVRCQHYTEILKSIYKKEINPFNRPSDDMHAGWFHNTFDEIFRKDCREISKNPHSLWQIPTRDNPAALCTESLGSMP